MVFKRILSYDGSLFFGDTFLHERSWILVLPSQSLTVGGSSLLPLTALLPGIYLIKVDNHHPHIARACRGGHC